MKWRFHGYNNISFHGAFENALLQVHGSKWKIGGDIGKLPCNLPS
jgi:hypothetical protein